MFARIRLVCILSVISAVDSECTDLPSVQNAEVKVLPPSPIVTGSTVTLGCKSGYSRLGYGVFTCNGTNWTGGLECTEIKCGRVNVPRNGFVANTPSYEAGSLIIFDCQDGYKIDGESRLFCKIDGSWSPSSPPTCRIKRCEPFQNIQNGEMIQESKDGEVNVYGSTVSFKCFDEYILNGHRDIVCNADGQWSAKPPTCDPISCPPHPATNTSCLEKTVLHQGLALKIRCKVNNADISVTQIGSLVSCFEKVWDDLTVGCFCDCKVDRSDKNLHVQGLTSNSFLKHGKKLTWGCINGATKDPSVGTIQCYDGQMGLPLCIPPPTTITSTSSAGKPSLPNSRHTPTDTFWTSESDSNTLTSFLAENNSSGMYSNNILIIVSFVGLLI